MEIQSLRFCIFIQTDQSIVITTLKTIKIMTKLYVASSWSNPKQPWLVEKLREKGFDVYDFRHPSGRADKNIWDVLEVNKEKVFTSVMVELMDMKEAEERFKEHLEAMQQADACVLYLPCGNSAHIEAGYMKGLGKKVYVFGEFEVQIKPELMYYTFDGFYNFYENLFAELKKLDRNKYE